MTNQERAEKIINQIEYEENIQLRRPLDNAIEFITSQLDEAVREARESVLNEQKCNGCGCSHERCYCNPIREMKAREEGFATAREKAAGIAVNEGDTERCEDCRNVIEHIRAMEP